jgi:hypothetical protein
VFLPHLIHALSLDEVKFLSHELVDSGGRASSCDECIAIRKGDSSGVVQELIVLLVDSLNGPRLVVSVQDDHFVGVTEETDLFVSHLHGLMVNARRLLNKASELVHVKLNFRVRHLNRDQLLGLVRELFFLTLELLEPASNISPLNLLAPNVF